MFAKSRLISVVAILLCAAGISPLAAQQKTNPGTANAPQSEEFRRKAPTPLTAKPLMIPRPYETTLANGLRGVVLEDKRLPLVSYRLAFRTGNANNPAELPGLTAMMTGLLNEGTETLTSKQIADEIARMGATLGATSASDSTTVSASALSMYSTEILNLMADVALHP